MTAYYTREKAKFGGTTGTIVPFTIQLPSTNFPNFGDWKNYLPAGFLRCDGGIFSAAQFPALASVIGTGSDCPFAKDPENLADDLFQLPDLGSKYIKASIGAGEYFNNIVSTNENGLERVGAEVAVSTLIGTTAEISYAGTFEVAGQPNIPFGGNPIFESTENDGYTFNDFLTEENWQAHGHTADVGVLTYTGNWKDSGLVNDFGGDTEASNEGSNNLVQSSTPDGSVVTSQHNHQIELPKSAELKAGTTFNFTVPNGIQIDPTGLVTTVNLSTENVEKLDKAISPYILMEYIIKI